MFELKNKVALITGASGGLGEQMALALSKQGAKIAILDIKEKEGKKVTKKIKTNAHFYKTDILDEEDIKSSINSVKKDFGKIDILVNNAGVFYQSQIKSTSKEDWEKLISVNVTGYFLVTKNCIPLMKKGGKIINISSVAGHHAFANSTAYNVSKGAVIQMTKSMAIEYSQKGINVNAICPGMFTTSMTQNLLRNKEVKKMIESSVLLKRAGKTQEIAGLIIYLSSDECSYMTGSIITIDGGWTCHL